MIDLGPIGEETEMQRITVIQDSEGDWCLWLGSADDEFETALGCCSQLEDAWFAAKVAARAIRGKVYLKSPSGEIVTTFDPDALPDCPR